MGNARRVVEREPVLAEPPVISPPEPSPPLVEPPPAPTPELALPPRAEDAETGSEFIARMEALGRAAIDDAVVAAVTAGNIPAFQRKLVPLSLADVDGVRGTLHVMCDYLAIGSDEDFIRMPMTSAAAQRIANLLDATLPTPKMVDLIYAAAPAKLPPSYIEGGPTEGTVEDFVVHHDKLERRRVKAGYALGVLTAGHKKDIVLSVRLAERHDRVAIYGWHKQEGDVVQPLSCRHSCRYADYSHGVRLVSQAVEIDGEQRRVTEVLADPDLASLISDEGPLPIVEYSTTLPEYVPTSKKRKRKKSTRANR